MKATGVVRKIDGLGRIVLPMELRRTFDIQVNDPLEIYVDGEQVLLKKYEPGCVFCGKVNGVVYFHDKYICKHCKEQIANDVS